MLAAITSGLTQIITWFGTVIQALLGTEGALAPLLPLLVIGICISLVLLSVKLIRKVSWGA